MRAKTTSLLILLSLAGCGGAGTTGGLPALSQLATADPTASTVAQTCHSGLLLTELPRLGVDEESVRTSAGVWHMVYTAVYVDDSGATYTGLRYLTSAAPSVASSIAWAGNYHIVIGSDDVPTLFFFNLMANGAPPTLSRARLVSGSWQIDPKPIWTSPDGNSRSILGSLDAGGHAHLLIGNHTLLSDAGDSWVATDLTTPASLAPAGVIYDAIADPAGNEYILHDDSTTTVSTAKIATNVSGSWQNYDGGDGFFALDPSGAVHLFSVDADGANIDDALISATGSSVTVLKLNDSLGIVADAKIDGAGNPVLVISAMGNPNSLKLWTNVSGAWQSQPMPFSYGLQQLSLSEALDAQGAAHFAAAYLGSAGALENQLAFVEPCQ